MTPSKKKKIMGWLHKLPKDQCIQMIETLRVLVKYYQIINRQNIIEQDARYPKNQLILHHQMFSKTICARNLDEEMVLDETSEDYITQVWTKRKTPNELLATLSRERAQLEAEIYQWTKKYSPNCASIIYSNTLVGVTQQSFTSFTLSITPESGSDSSWDSIVNFLKNVIIAFILIFVEIVPVIPEEDRPTAESLAPVITAPNMGGAIGGVVGFFFSYSFGLMTEIVNLSAIFLSQFIQNYFFNSRTNIHQAIVKPALLPGNPTFMTLWSFTVCFVFTLFSLFSDDTNPLKSAITGVGFAHLFLKIFHTLNKEVLQLSAEESSRTESQILMVSQALGAYLTPRLFDSVLWPIISIVQAREMRAIILSMLTEINGTSCKFPSIFLQAWFGYTNFSLSWQTPDRIAYEATCTSPSNCTVINEDYLP